jgi:LysR family transcriptional regulator, glycine cleavage system transcriptional activator
MSTRLPPLNALRTFEAAARLLSFTRAAEELFVTQAAVSHQIKTLEEHLGVPLFRRLNRRLILTDEGQLLLPAVRQAFDALTAGVERVHQQCCRGALTISTTPSFAANWLAPRLGRFQALWPDFEISLSATPRLVDLVREGVDCGVRYGFGDWPGLRADRLFGHELVPVCSPVLVAGEKPLGRPEDLRHHTLLHVLSDMDDWRLWLRAAGISDIDPVRGLKFDTGPLALAAAIAGAGVAITHRRLVADDLAAGRLVELFDLELPIESAYYFIAPEGTADLPKVALFRDWILAEARAGDGAAPVPRDAQSLPLQGGKRSLESPVPTP